jgi:(1->4)-alpha-D-glucan 1-alpha-D-glucosylmutase
MVTTPEPDPRPRIATYRVQLRAAFGFDEAAAIAGYLAELGVSQLYSSPCLQAAAGSTHGYDVVDPARLNAELGGAEGHARLAARLAELGLGQVLDIVPNHMAVGGRANAWWWDVLEHGAESRYADYFDIDWDPPQPELAGLVLVPVLGDHYGRVLEAGQLTVRVQGETASLHYHEHELPLARRTLDGLTPAAAEALNRDPGQLDALLRRQNYRLAYWRAATTELNYRRFFDITTLAGVRVEDPQVFADTHRLILRMVRDGSVDGLRIDHVDGLADPEGYLRRLHEASGGCYTVVEKILEPGEDLPSSWPVAGTSGYDFLNAVNQLFVDQAGREAMLGWYTWFTGESADWAETARAAKLQVMRDSLAAEVERLTGLLARVCDRHRRVRDFSRDQLRELLHEVLAAFPVYRSYARPGRPVDQADRDHVAAALAEAARRRPGLDGELLAFTGELLTGAHPGGPETEFTVHFAQVSAPVMAKGVEDTAFYRWTRFTARNEVGGDPCDFGIGLEEFHEAAQARQRSLPRSMTTLSTHDTKRSEDVRARLAVLSELPGDWTEVVRRWVRAAPLPDPSLAHLVWQAAVGAWPIERDRLQAYALKAAREAGASTTWQRPDERFESALREMVDRIFDDPALHGEVADFATAITPPGWSNSLGQKLVQLAGPGVPDVYQGTELWDYSLVDPDNRRPVDFALRRELLGRIDAGWQPPVDAGGAAKLLVTARTLRLRRERPELFSGYRPLFAEGRAGEHVLAFDRGGVVAVATRLPVGLSRHGGWDDATLSLDGRDWTDVFTATDHSGGRLQVADLLRTYPVALLVKR